MATTATTTTTYAPPPGPPPTSSIYSPPPGPPPSHSTSSANTFQSPSGIPPPDIRPPLLPTSSPLDLHTLATTGYISLTSSLPTAHPDLLRAYHELFSLSNQFFALPADDADKVKFQAASGSQASEEGFSHIQGEKQILTCRAVQRSPERMREGVRKAWAASGALMGGVMKDITRSLGLHEGAYDAWVTPCLTFPEEDKTPTLLRMFRYDRPTDGAEARVVAEAHKDLGLLSLVIGHSPGLDVFEPPSAESPEGRWISIEEGGEGEGGEPKLTATLLGGQILNFLTRGRYRPGVHRVSVRPAETPYRFSLVFTLRPYNAPVHTTFLQSPQVGLFLPNQTMRGEPMGLLFDRIMRSHWNINVSKDLRDKQRTKLERKKIGAEPEDHADGVMTAADGESKS